MPGPEVVLEAPDSGGEIHTRIAQPGLPDVDQSGQKAVHYQHVRQAVIPVDQDVAALSHTERTVRAVGGVNGA